MIVVPPLAITSAIFTSSTASEPRTASDYVAGTTYAIGATVKDPATWIVYQSLLSGNVGNTPSGSPLYWQQIGYNEVAYNAATTYGLGGINIVYSAHRVYISLQAANTGHDPLASPTWWQDIGPTNQWASVDLLRNTASVAASPLTIVLTPGQRIDTVGCVGVVADSVRCQVTSSGVSVYDQTISIASYTNISNWYQYFYATFYQGTSAIFQSIPPYTNAVVTLTFARASGNVSCGSIVIGSAVDLGAVQYSAVDDAINFSTITRDTYGNSVLIPRRSVPKTSQITFASKDNIAAIRATRALLNAAPALWAGLTDSANSYFPSLLILGIYKTFSINVAQPNKAVLTLELEEI